jgi:hypothetical protein
LRLPCAGKVPVTELTPSLHAAQALQVSILDIVIAGFMPATHEHSCGTAIMGGRDKPGHDGDLEMAEPRADHRFMESTIRSKLLFGRNSGRKPASHFSWNWSRPPPVRPAGA